jgi:hypothetical protein
MGPEPGRLIFGLRAGHMKTKPVTKEGFYSERVFGLSGNFMEGV